MRQVLAVPALEEILLTEQHPLGEKFFSGESSEQPVVLSDDAFHGIAGDFVRTVLPHTEADPVALLTNFLVAAGILFGREAYALADGRKHYPSEFLIMVGATGKGRKGTATTHVFNAMDRVEEDFRKLHVISGLSSGEGLIKAMSDEGKMAQAHHRFIGRLDEFGSLLQVMRREGNIMSAVLRQSWDGDPLNVETKNDPLHVSDYVLSLIGHVTPDELLNGLDRIDRTNGFGNRFVFVRVERSKFLPEGGGEYNINEIVSRLHRAVSQARFRGRVCRDDAAKELWAEVYPQLASPPPGLRGALCSRAEAHTLRFSLLYALLDCADTIRVEHLKAALAIWRYAEASVSAIFTNQSGDFDTDRILEALATGAKGISELHRVFANKKTSEWLMAKLSSLIRQGLIVPTFTEGDRKTVNGWKLRGRP